MAIFKWSNKQFMTEEEYKNTPDDKKPYIPVPPKMFDLSKAERIKINKEDLKVTEIQAEQEKLS